jgi:hypothetical protein
MIDRARLDPSLLAKPEMRSHGTLVQEIARNQTRLGRLARAVAEPAAAPDAASASRLARLSDAQAVTDALGAARQFEIAAERLMSMSHLAAAARATDLAERTRDNAGRQFEALKWQALNALRNAAGSMRAAGAWQLHADPGQVSLALTRISIATPDAAAAAASALNAALAAVETTRAEIAETAIETDEAEALDADELAKRIAAQAAKSTEAQANIAPGNARLLLS